ncbi:MAG: nitroreductase family protein [Bacteroidales bacterium]|nr:nitroreductase family protein [Bacteroidales bacterium]MDT8372452.1 nitroreductase family protein [Bacteroidales bacterium]
MKKAFTNLSLLLIVVLIIFPVMLDAQDLSLPAPMTAGGKPLMDALSERQSSRSFSDRELSLQQLSDLLWAAWGINRSADGQRTAPSSHNRQEMDVYVTLKSGLYLYDAGDNLLKQIHGRDIRALTGIQDFPALVPVNLVYVADLTKRGLKEDQAITDTDLLSSWANTGFMAQNVYLYCASAGLSTVIRAMVPRQDLAAAMMLKPWQTIILAQTIGLPADSQ